MSEPKMWLTPRVNEPENDTGFVERNGDRGAHCFGSLADQVRHTPSSTSLPATAASPSPSKLWQTPSVEDAGRAGSAAAWKEYEEEGRTTQCRLRNQVHFAPSASRRSSPMPVPCSPTDSLVCPTSAPFSQSPEIAYFTSAVRSRLSLLVAFRASRTAPPASAGPAPTSATSGANVSESLASYDPASHSLRTYQVSLLPREDGSSTECLVTWPGSGTLAHGKCYPRPTLERPTDGNGSGCSALTSEQPEGLPWAWPTATARDHKGAYRPESMIRKDGKSRAWDTLDQAVVSASASPTPTASEGTKIPSQANYRQMGLSNHPAIVGLPTRPKGTKDRKGQPDSGPPPTASGLPDPASRNTSGSPAGLSEDWPTPSASRGNHTSVNPDAAEANRERGQQMGLGYKVALTEKSWATPTGDNANNATRTSGDFQSLTRQAGKLNPAWVETLMGLPLGWTQLPRKFVKPRTTR